MAEEGRLLAMEGVGERMSEIDNLIESDFNAVVSHPSLKVRLVSYMTLTKSCFAIYGNKQRNGTVCSKLQDIGSKHPISHL